MTDETYSNEHQRSAVEYLLDEGFTVMAGDNSEIKVYVNQYQSLSARHPELGPYEIVSVHGLKDESKFQALLTLGADWTEVDDG